MNNFKKLAVAVALCACASGALAQSANTDWTGFYIGVNAGHANGSADVTTSTVYSGSGYFDTTSVPAIAAAGNGELSPSGFVGGVTGGYNWQHGAAVFGLEADYDSLNADDDRVAGSEYPCCASTSFSVMQTTKADDLFTLRGRVGIASGHSLLYITAGWAQAKIKVQDSFNDTFAGAQESFRGSQTKSDWIYGVGYEHAIGDRWSIKAEYLHADFGTVTGVSNNLTAYSPTENFPDNPFTHSSDLELNMFRLGVNYRF